MAVLENLEPKKVFHFFEELSAVPRETFDMQRISDHCVAFAKERGLEVIQDDCLNVIIRKPGTPGYEDCEPVILQGHMDMVGEKRPGSDHDFKKDGLKLYVEDGFIKAKDTTLGGDDGIAVAMAMAILDSDDIPHPPIEALFTVDEETGMGGANGIDMSIFKGRKVVNLDSEVEGVLTCGCAGGIEYEAAIPVHREKKEGTKVTVRIHGLNGGHSGSEIHQQRGNAHKMMGRFLYRLSKEVPFTLIDIFGGAKHNVIAMECEASLMASAEDAEKIAVKAQEMKEIWDHEFMGEEEGLKVDVERKADAAEDACDEDSTGRVIGFLAGCPNGLQEYSRKLKGIVETSLNIGVVDTQADCIKMGHLIRSSVESRKVQLKEQLDLCAELAGGTGRIISQYPAWQFDPDSELRKIMVESFREVYGREPEVSVVHAGLECGIFLGKRPDLDCVSIGPDLPDIHSFNERMDIASTQRTWEYLKTILKNCK